MLRGELVRTEYEHYLASYCACSSSKMSAKIPEVMAICPRSVPKAPVAEEERDSGDEPWRQKMSKRATPT